MTTILLIDDDEQIQDFLQMVLEQEGYAVLRADNGAMGVRKYRQRPTDLVLCDIFMDQQDGLETIRQLRKEFPQAKIIAMSGGSTRAPGDFLSYAEKFGAVATLQKPLDRKSLLQVIQKLCRRDGEDKTPAIWGKTPDARKREIGEFTEILP
jgi:CheY-like chemotaxis protein